MPPWFRGGGPHHERLVVLPGDIHQRLLEAVLALVGGGLQSDARQVEPGGTEVE